MKNSVQQFNALDGKTVSREELWALAALAEKENQGEVYGKITNLLNDYSDKSFVIELTSKAKWVPQKGLGCPGTDCGCNGLGCPGENCSCGNKGQQPANGLGAARHSGLAKEALTDCGRLRPGYVYRKGGVIEKVEKKKTTPKKKTNKAKPKKEKASPKPATPKPVEKAKENKPEVKKVDVRANSAKAEKYIKRVEELEASIKANTEKMDKMFKEQTSNQDRSQAYKLMEERGKLRTIVNKDQEEVSHLANIVVALKNGGEVRDITDKKGKEHKEIADFTQIDTSNIEFDEGDILSANIPPYIPLLDQKALERRGFVFDSIRIDEDSYLTATKSHDEKGSHYVILTLDQLVLTSDYYLKMTKALYQKQADEKNVRSEEHWNSISDERKERHYSQRNQKGLYDTMPAKVKKTISFEKWEKLPWQEKEKVYKFYKRYGSKRIKSKLSSDQMWMSMHQMYERFIDPTATPPKPRYANPKVFAYWRKFREMLKYKMLDIDIQRGDYAETRKKGLETSFGDSNTSNQLLKKHGIKVKRQNGDAINPAEISEIEDAFVAVEKVFGNMSHWARNFGLKISHSGNKLIYARKAVGVYAPFFKAIGVSAKYGHKDFSNTLAHELAHFLDHQIGIKTGKRYESDNYESTAGLLAGIFRENMNGIDTITSNYTLSTKECFARALEQYYAMETFGKNVTIFYSEMEGPLEGMKYVDAENHVPEAVFYAKVVPLIKKFFKEVESTQPPNVKGLGAPRGKVYNIAEMEIGLSAAKHVGVAKIALDNCGRLKPGYFFAKGGEIKKVEKPKKKGAAAVKKTKKATKETETEKIINTIHRLAKLALSDMQGFKRSKSKYRLGQMWSTNFDYHGAVELAMTIDENWPLSKLEKLHSSLEDVNYHDLGRHIWDLMLHKKGVSAKDRKSAMGLGNPIVLDSGEPYPHLQSPGQPADNRDAAGTVLDIPVNSPQIVDPTSVKPKVSASTNKKSGLVKSMSQLGNGSDAYYKSAGDLGRFMGQVEVKPYESVVTTLDAPQGAMKTRLFFQLIDNYVSLGYKVLFVSLEEHPDSTLFKKKRDEYLSANLHDKVDVVGELPNGIKDFHGLVPNYDIIFVDSWGKLVKNDKNVDMDNDLRKRYDGKWFYIIYQRTTSGTMRGGASSQFDGDQIMKIHKDPESYENNYAYWDKNRYESEPGLKYNIFNKNIAVENIDSQQVISGDPVEMI
tara:strand:+ start:5007 stop:8618 length:3612 start_codon:yes stop_codon:yes gene_type:complete